jgi:hypothetical protein
MKMLSASTWDPDDVGCSGGWVARLSKYHEKEPRALGSQVQLRDRWGLRPGR